ncbi:MAG: hypothetical protein ACRC6B_02235, partial [Fusobacteriaceae bacterium]
MKKCLLFSWMFVISMMIYSSEGDFGIVYDEDFKAVGVSEINLRNAKLLMENTSINVKKISLDKRQLELEANRLLLDGAEKNIQELEKAMDKLGAIEATRLKNQVKSQIQMYKYITRQQYIQAREKALTRLKKEQDTEAKIEGEVSGEETPS